jgi:hypothetical protein
MARIRSAIATGTLRDIRKELAQTWP